MTTKRVARLRRLLRQLDLPALLISNPVNVTYLTGFTGEDSFLLITATDAVLVSDARFTTQLSEECPQLDVALRGATGTTLDLVARLAKKLKVPRLGVEASSLTLQVFDQLSVRLSRAEVVPVDRLVERLRVIKDASEIKAVRRAVRMAEQAMRSVLSRLTADRSEKQTAADIEYEIRRFGGAGCSFPSIVAVGSRGALPHAPPTSRQIGESDFVLIDWGANESRYCSDLTRIFVTGKISPKLRRVYGVVLKAQCRAIESIRPGVRLGKVDAAARSVIVKAGYGKKFTHALGHGIGLDVHETPRIAADQSETLQAGMIVTIEPGIYLPGWGGIRIEDDILVTRDGHEVLSTFPKELGDCVLDGMTVE